MISCSTVLELQMSTEAAKRLLEIGNETGAFLVGDYTLASGDKSNHYFDGKKITLSPEGTYRVGEAVLEALGDVEVDAVGGLTIGADPIAAAVALVSYLKGKPIPAFIVRWGPKDHGTGKDIEGHLPPKGGKVAIVDDVITKGTSVFKAIEAVEARGCRVAKVVVLVDRHQGGSDELRRKGYNFEAIMRYTGSGKVILEEPRSAG